MPEEFSPVPGEAIRNDIRNPEGLSLVDLPRTEEDYEDKGGRLLIRPHGFPESIEPIIGARIAEKDTIPWTKGSFYEDAGIDSTNVVGIQQKHTANIREVTDEMRGSGALFKAGDEDTRIKAVDGSGLDAVWTREKDLTLVIATADCAAILVSGKGADDQDIVGVAHAGIVGAQGDVVGHLIKNMTENGGVRPETIQAYSGPDICERCYPVMSTDLSDERTDRMPKVKIKAKEDGQEIEVTKLTASVLQFRRDYNKAFKKIHGRDLAENDFYYVDYRAKPDAESGKTEVIHELHLNLNMFIYLSLIGNGVDSQKIGFSSICSAHDTLPSYYRKRETTGIFSTISIKE